MTPQERRDQFIEKHLDAHVLVFDTRTKVPLQAIYYAPDWQATPEVIDADLRRFFALVREEELRRQNEGREIQTDL
jgi:hypothetical protein